MPNWCANTLTLTHRNKNKLQEFCDAYNSGAVCNHYIPKPEGLGDGWWDWCIANWGTKWDFGKDDYSESAVVIDDGDGYYKTMIQFQTAWSPPIGFYNKLQKMKFMVYATYFEPGMAFCGIYDNGVDDCISYTSREEIPDILWDEYGMADFFEEEEEEVE